MSEFVESLKRLYENEKLSLSQIDRLLQNKKITIEEHLYILGKEGN